jgi:hypothetical protein
VESKSKILQYEEKKKESLDLKPLSQHFIVTRSKIIGSGKDINESLGLPLAGGHCRICQPSSSAVHFRSF